MLADSTATGTESVAIGPVATSVGASSVAIGLNSKATNANDVALGSGSVSSAVNSVAGNAALGIANNANTGVASTVAIGTAAVTRQLQFVAAGAVSSTSTDAVNGSQLFSVQTNVNTVGSAVATNLGGGSTYTAATGVITAPSYAIANIGVGGALGAPITDTNVGAALGGLSTDVTNLAGAINGGGIKYFHSNSVLADWTATGTDSVAIGPAAVASKVNDIAIGNAAQAKGGSSIALGDNAIASGASSISIGKGNIVSGANSGAFGDPNTITGAGAYAVGNNNTIAANNAFAIGNNITVAAGLVGSVGIGNGSTVTAPNTGVFDLTGGTAAAIAPTSVVSIGAAGFERQLTNVAAGVLSATSTDAVNGSQLFSVATSSNKLGTTVASTIGAGTTFAPATGLTGYSTAYAGGAQTTIKASLDALNGYSTKLAAGTISSLGGLASVAADGTVTNPSYTIAGSTYNNVGSALAALASGGASSKYFHVSSILVDSAATGTDSVAIGPVATALGTSSVAIGLNSKASNANDIALGAGSLTAAPNSGTTALYGGTAAGIAVAASGTVSVGCTGTERQIQNVAAGVISATSTDAINGSQLNSVVTGVNALGVSVATDLGGSAKFDPTTGKILAPTYAIGTSKFNDVGSALAALQLSAPVQYTTALGSVTPNGLTPSNTMTLVGTGLGNATPVALTNVAAGSTTAISLDAVNGGQINTVGTSIAANFGGGAKYDPVTGKVLAPTYAVAGGSFSDVGSALTALNSTASKGLNFTANDGTAINVALGGTLPIIGGSVKAAGLAFNTAAPTAGTYSSANVQTFADATGGIQIQLANAPVFAGAITSSGITEVAGSVINMGGNVVSGVAAGSTTAISLDAVNGGQINTVGTSIATNFGGGAKYDPVTGKVLAPTYAVAGGSFNDVGSALTALNGTASKGLNFTGNDGVAINVALGGTLPIIGGSVKAAGLAFNTAAPTAGTYSSANIQTFADSKTGQIQIQLADNAVFTSLTTGNAKLDTTGLTITGGPSVLATGIDAGSKLITNVAAGSTAAISLDAVNGGQINTIGTAIAANFGGGAKYDAVTGKVLAPTYAVAGGSFNDVGSALTALNTVAGAGWNLSTNGGAATNVVPGATVNFTSGSSSVTLTQTGTKVTVDLAPNINVTSVTTGNTKIDTNGLTIVGGPSVLATGIDAGSKAITNVAAGVAATDAVNKGQLDAVTTTAAQGINVTTAATGTGTVTGTAVSKVASGGTATFTAGNNIAITQNGTEVQIATSMTPSFTKVTTGGLTVNAGSVVDLGSNVITNVAQGVGNTDAVNVGQLNAAIVASGSASVVQYSNAAGVKQTAPSNDVTLVGAGGPVVIHNLGAGTAPTDAVNVGQLALASPGKWQAATSSNFTLGNPNGTAPNAPVTVSNLAAATLSDTSTEAVNGSQLYATNQAVNNLAALTNGLQGQISANKQAARAGTAAAMALGMIRYDDRPGKLSLGIAGAAYGGQSGIAFGAGYTSEDMRLRASLGGTFAPTNPDQDFGVGGSLTWTFN